MKKYNQLNEIPISEIEAFINATVIEDKISASYQRSLVGNHKKNIRANRKSKDRIKLPLPESENK
ncbi:hypothetical protein GCM10027051_24700 [Niabella terrae]